MRESFIFSEEPTPNEADDVKAYLNETRENVLRPLEGEIEKTPEEIEFIERMNQYVDEEFAALGVNEKSDILPERIHIMSKDGYEKISMGKSAHAFAIPIDRVAFLNKASYDNKYGLYQAIFHESIHLLSFHKNLVEIGEGRAEERKMVIKPVRFGHLTKNVAEPKHEHFRGLMEAITDKTVIEIFNRHKDELLKDFGVVITEKPHIYTSQITDTEGKQITMTRMNRTDHLEVLDTIIKKIAEKQGASEQDVWKRFEKGQFTGEIMHLRKDIERTFGNGSLRVLAALDSGTKELPFGEASKKIIAYFNTDDEKERDRIANEILNEREIKRYEKRRGKTE